jgi:hypothetical protein
VDGAFAFELVQMGATTRERFAQQGEGPVEVVETLFPSHVSDHAAKSSAARFGCNDASVN